MLITVQYSYLRGKYGKYLSRLLNVRCTIKEENILAALILIVFFEVRYECL